MNRPPSSPPTCANCGADIPPKSTACPECGADERTGWREQDIYDGLDLPEEEIIKKPNPSPSAIIWKITGLLLLAFTIFLILRGHW